MSDGDNVPFMISSRFRQLYLQVWEGELSEDDLVRKALESLKKEVKFFGDGPLHLIIHEEEFFHDLFLRYQRGDELNWAHERRELKQLQQDATGDQRALDLVMEACEDQLRELELFGRYTITAPNYQQELLQKYLTRVYDSRFTVLAMLPMKPPKRQVEPELVGARVAEMRPGVIKGIWSYTEQIMHQIGRAHV